MPTSTKDINNTLHALRKGFSEYLEEISKEYGMAYKPQDIVSGMANSVYSAPTVPIQHQPPLNYATPAAFTHTTPSTGHSPLCADITPQWGYAEPPLMDMTTLLNANMALMNSLNISNKYGLNHFDVVSTWHKTLCDLGMDSEMYTRHFTSAHGNATYIQLTDLRTFLICINRFHAPTRLELCREYVKLETQMAQLTSWNVTVMEQFLSDISGDLVYLDTGETPRNEVAISLYDVVNYNTNFNRSMTSWELTYYYGGRHYDCMHSIRNTLDKCGIDPNQFLSTERDIHGRLLPVLTLPKVLVLLCVTGWDVQALAGVVDRYMQLKASDLIEMAKAIENYAWVNGCTPVYTHMPIRTAAYLSPADVNIAVMNKYGHSLLPH